MIEKSKLPKNGAVGRLQRNTKLRQCRFVQLMAQVMRRGDRRGGNIRSAAGHPFSDGNS